MKQLLTALLIAATLATACMAANGTNSAASGIVGVVVTYQEPDQFMPWRNDPLGAKSGYAFVVNGTDLLTTEGMTRSARVVELMKPRNARRIAARVKLADVQANLALLSVEPGALGQMHSLELADSILQNEPVQVVQFNETGEVQTGNGTLLHPSMALLPTSPYTALRFSVLTDLNVNGQGAVVVQNGKVAGLVMSYEPTTRVGSVLPCTSISRFLADASNPPYEGIASAGMVWEPLTDPARREYLGATHDDAGILVLSCLPGTSAADVLKPNDVILEWDGFALDNLGYYDDPELGRLESAHIVKHRHRPGDVIPVTLLRDGAKEQKQLTLQNWADSRSLIPDDTEGARPGYVVEGGIIMRELTGRYLREHGIHWETDMDPRLVHIYMTRRHKPERPGERIVVISGVLPDPINVSYENVQNEIVTAVNGRPVNNMGDVLAAKSADGYITRITVKSVGVDLVLDRDRLEEANERIASLYQISDLVGGDGIPSPGTRAK